MLDDYRHINNRARAEPSRGDASVTKRPGLLLAVQTADCVPILLADPKNRVRFAEMAPARRLGTPEDLSGIAVFLASEDSSYCVGGIFTVDGGLTAV